MKTKLQTLLVMSAALSLLCIAGCGGGGGDGPLATGTRTVGIYVTDGFDDDYSQVWVTLYRITASSDGATFRTVWDDPDGKTLNLSRLANSAEFLGAVDLSSTAISRVRVTIGDHILLVPGSGGSAQRAPVDDSLPTANGKAVISFDVTNPGSHRDLVIDFDLASFQIILDKVRPHVKHGDDSQFAHKQKHGELEGVVSHLTAADYVLVYGNRSIVVRYDIDTAIFHNGTGAPALLAIGQSVRVRGAVDPDTRVMFADSIKIQENDVEEHYRAEAEGVVLSVNHADRSFVLTLHEAEHFTPRSGTIKILTTSSTVFEKQYHGAAGLSDIIVGQRVDAAGVYDAETNMLTVRRVSIGE